MQRASGDYSDCGESETQPAQGSRRLVEQLIVYLKCLAMLMLMFALVTYGEYVTGSDRKSVCFISFKPLSREYACQALSSHLHQVVVLSIQ